MFETKTGAVAFYGSWAVGGALLGTGIGAFVESEPWVDALFGAAGGLVFGVVLHIVMNAVLDEIEKGGPDY